MKITLKKQPKSIVELTIEVPHDVYLKGEQQALVEINKVLKVPGFRQGHIPEAVVRERVPEASLREETLNVLIPQTYAQAVRDQEVAVIAQPKVEVKQWPKQPGDAFIYVAVVAVMPEVKMGNYKKIKVARDSVAVTTKQVDEVVGQILERFSTFHDVERAAQATDRVEIDFEGFDDKGQAVPNTQSKNHPLVLGSKTFIPGFEEAVVGMKKGEMKESPITFPKDYHETKLQNKKITFKITLHRVEEKKTAELTPETIKKIIGKEQSADEFRKQVEADLKSETGARAQQKQESQAIEEVIKITKAELPESLIQEELQHVVDQRKEQVKEQGITWDQYLQHMKTTEEEFLKNHKEYAEKNILARLGIQSIIKEEKITVEDQAIDAKIQETVARYPEAQRKEVAGYYQKGSRGYDLLRSQMVIDQVIAFLTKA